MQVGVVEKGEQKCKELIRTKNLPKIQNTLPLLLGPIKNKHIEYKSLAFAATLQVSKSFGCTHKLGHLPALVHKVTSSIVVIFFALTERSCSFRQIDAQPVK